MLKLIPGYLYYFVSEVGEIFSIRPNFKNSKRKLAVHIRDNGYLSVELCPGRGLRRKNLRVHRAVAMAFLPNPKNLPIVMHLDNNKKNNNVENLKWATVTENNLAAERDGLHAPCRGEESGKSKLTDGDVKDIRNLFASGMSQKNIAKRFPVKRSTIHGIVRNKAWKHLL